MNDDKIIKKGLNTIEGVSSKYLYVWLDYDNDKIKIYSDNGVKYVSLSFDRDMARTATARKFSEWFDTAELVDATPEEISMLDL